MKKFLPPSVFDTLNMLFDEESIEDIRLLSTYSVMPLNEDFYADTLPTLTELGQETRIPPEMLSEPKRTLPIFRDIEETSEQQESQISDYSIVELLQQELYPGEEIIHIITLNLPLSEQRVVRAKVKGPIRTTIDIDLRTGRSVDFAKLLQKEQQKKKQIYGKKDVSLYNYIQEKSPNTLIPVLIALGGKVPTLRELFRRKMLGAEVGSSLYLFPRISDEELEEQAENILATGEEVCEQFVSKMSYSLGIGFERIEPLSALAMISCKLTADEINAIELWPEATRILSGFHIVIDLSGPVRNSQFFGADNNLGFYSIATGFWGKDLTVAIVESGPVDFSVASLGQNPAKNTTDNTHIPVTTHPSDHATQVSHWLAAQSNSKYGNLLGPAQGVKLLSANQVKTHVYPRQFQGVAALNWAFAKRPLPNLFNFSIVTGDPSTRQFMPWNSISNRASEIQTLLPVLTIMGAGNDDVKKVVGNANPNGIVVGTYEDYRYPQNNAANPPGYPDLMKPDVVAAGGVVATSLATPLVTALAAIIINHIRTFTSKEVNPFIRKYSSPSHPIFVPPVLFPYPEVIKSLILASAAKTWAVRIPSQRRLGAGAVNGRIAFKTVENFFDAVKNLKKKFPRTFLDEINSIPFLGSRVVVNKLNGRSDFRKSRKDAFKWYSWPPNGAHPTFQAQKGQVIRVALVWNWSGPDYDLFLQYDNGTEWVDVASSANFTANTEVIEFDVQNTGVYRIAFTADLNKADIEDVTLVAWSVCVFHIAESFPT